MALSKEWETDKGVNGYRFTGSNGKPLFLPAAGCWYDTDLGGAGSLGYYWSSSLDEYSSYGAWYVYFSSGEAYSGISGRCFGQSVRPVTE